MSETASKLGWRDVPDRAFETLKEYGRRVRYYYRIRPIPGWDVDAASGRAISFNDMFRELWVDRRVLITAVALALALSIPAAILSPPSYQATLNIAASESNFSDSSGDQPTQSLLSAFTRTAASYDDFSQFLDLLHSVRLAKRLDAKYGLMKQVFPYNAKTKQFFPPPDVVSRLQRAGRWALGLPAWQPPDFVDLAQYLSRSISADRSNNGTAVLTHYGRTPQEASSFLNHAFAETDALMREEKLNSHRLRSAYLAQRLADTSALEQRTLLIGLWGREENQILLLTSGDPVGARKIDDIHAPNMPQSSVLQILLMGFLFGFLLGLFAVLARSAIRRAG